MKTPTINNPHDIEFCSTPSTEAVDESSLTSEYFTIKLRYGDLRLLQLVAKEIDMDSDDLLDHLLNKIFQSDLNAINDSATQLLVAQVADSLIDRGIKDISWARQTKAFREGCHLDDWKYYENHRQVMPQRSFDIVYDRFANAGLIERSPICC